MSAGFWETPLGYKTYEHLCSRRNHAPACVMEMIAEAIEIMADDEICEAKQMKEKSRWDGL